MDRRQLPLVVVSRDKPALALHHGGQRQRLAAGARAQVDHLFPRFCRRQQRRELRALVLHLDAALDEDFFGLQARVAGIGAERDAQAQRRPPRRRRAEMGKRGQRLVARGLQRVDAHIQRRPACHRRGLRDAGLAEHPREIRIEPFRIVARDRRRRGIERSRRERRALVFAERLRREAPAVAQRRDGRNVEAALEPQHAEHAPARGIVVEQEGAGGAPAQHVEHQPRHRRAVAGPGETMRRAPVLEGIGGGHALCVDSGQDVDGRGQSGGGGHVGSVMSWDPGEPAKAQNANKNASAK